MTENHPQSTHDSPDSKGHAMEQGDVESRPMQPSATGTPLFPDPINQEHSFMEEGETYPAPSTSPAPASSVGDESILGQRVPPSSSHAPYTSQPPVQEQVRQEPAYTASSTAPPPPPQPTSTPTQPTPHHPNAVERGTRDILLASTGGLTMFLLALILFFASGSFWATSSIALSLVFASILMVVAIVLSLWAAVRSIRNLFKGEEDKGHYVAAIIMAVITVPLSAIFSVIALVSALVMWFQSAF